MNESDRTTQPTQVKRAYQAPALRVLGDVEELTAGSGTTPPSDGTTRHKP